MIEQLQYISQGATSEDHLSNIEDALKSGVKWVQLRMKDCTYIEYLETAQKAKQLTDSFNAKLIINDNVPIALEVNADGVHLGQDDMRIEDARKLVGKHMIIGGTANTLNQVIEHKNGGANYVGVGPFRFTSTKKKLSPILGLEGYHQLIQGLKENQIEIPVIAIGGIELEDITEIKNQGVHGIAVSGLITTAEDKSTLVAQIDKELLQWKN